MKHMNKAFAVIALAALTAFVGCDMTLEIRITPDPTGTVVNVKTGDPIGNAKVTLTYISGAEDGKAPSSSYSATSNSSGSFTFYSVEPGQYELTASASGEYAFTRQIVNVTGGGELPNVGGFVPDSDTALTILTFWDPVYKDIDAHLTFPDRDVTQSNTLPTLDPDGMDFYTYANIGSMDSGFMPDTTSQRFHVGYHPEIPAYRKYYAAPAAAAGIGTAVSSEAASTIYLDLDNKGLDSDIPGGPETMTIRAFPLIDSVLDTLVDGFYVAPSYVSAGDGDPSNLEEGSYYWIGVMEYYLHAHNKNTAATDYDDPDSFLSNPDSADSADAVVYVFQGNRQLGFYPLPSYTQIKTASVLKINLLYGKPVNDNPSGDIYPYYQILPDIRAYSGTDSIRSLGGSGTGIVTVKGPAL